MHGPKASRACQFSKLSKNRIRLEVLDDHAAPFFDSSAASAGPRRQAS
jgi:hypothetical protein